MKSFIIKSLTGIVFGFLFFSALFFLPKIYFSLILVSICAICCFEFYRLFPFNKKYLFLILPFYPIFSFILMILMNQNNKQLALFFLFAAVFVFDTFAYIFGKTLGKHKISEISPNKTWEGFFGGFLVLFLIMFYMNGEFLKSLLFSLIISMLAQVGDFFESWFKRKASIKDSGVLLPGHGGFLDRFDAVIFVAPIIYLVDYLL